MYVRQHNANRVQTSRPAISGMLCYLERQKQEEAMKWQHYVLTFVFFIGLSVLDALLPISVNTLLLAFIIIYLLHLEDASDV